ncbi:MAG TPA: GtrA family protein [Pseudolysinimonas sp.]|nr:GtrA family protein [Pseudolysinimonas sp.]
MVRSAGKPAPDTVAQAARYYLVAAAVAVGYLTVYGGVLLTGLGYPFAIALAQVVTISWAFPVYRSFVFRWPGSAWSAFPRFLAVWAGGLIAGVIATPALIEFGGVAAFPAQVITMVAVSVASFLLHRAVTFGQRGS